jgi:dephospho-CoA kinase
MTDTRKLVIGVAGRIGSGKTEVARLLERECGFQYLRYGFVLAEWRNVDPNAKTRLQQIGWEVMSGGEGQRELNKRLIALINPLGDTVVDGLRHQIDFDSLKNAFASRFFLIYVDTPPEIRFARLQKRFATYEDFVIADSHPVESNIDLLISCANAVEPGILPHEELRFELARLLRLFRTGDLA